jgi:hypothetical protein
VNKFLSVRRFAVESMAARQIFKPEGRKKKTQEKESAAAKDVYKPSDRQSNDGDPAIETISPFRSKGPGCLPTLPVTPIRVEDVTAVRLRGTTGTPEEMTEQRYAIHLAIDGKETISFSGNLMTCVSFGGDVATADVKNPKVYIYPKVEGPGRILQVAMSIRQFVEENSPNTGWATPVYNAYDERYDKPLFLTICSGDESRGKGKPKQLELSVLLRNPCDKAESKDVDSLVDAEISIYGKEPRKYTRREFWEILHPPTPSKRYAGHETRFQATVTGEIILVVSQPINIRLMRSYFYAKRIDLR